MRARLAAWSRPVLRVLVIAVLAYPLTAAAAANTDDADYMVGQSSTDGCSVPPPGSSGGWICWFPLTPDSP